MEQRVPASILEAAERKRSSLQGLAREFALLARERIEEEIERAKTYIIPWAPQPGEPRPHGAEDGGSGTIDFEHFTFYGVQAWAAAYEPRPEGARLVAEERAADVGIVLPAGAEEVRVRMYRETLEAWAAARAVRSIPGGVFYWDGGITPLIAGRRPWSEAGGRARELAERAASALGTSPESLEDIVAGCHSRGPLCVQSLIISSAEHLKGETSHLWVSYLEWLEKLEAVKRFLQEAFSAGVWPVFVTKTSRSRSLVRGALPDVYYLARATGRSVFHTRPVVRCTAIEFAGETDQAKARELTRRLLPGGYGEFFSGEVAVVTLYARLAAGSNILRIEIAGPARELCPLPAGEAASRALDAALSAPMKRGYPYPLVLAHRRASISRTELATAARVLGLGAESSGRGMLE